MKINNIKIKNFYSFKSEELFFKDKGLTLIKGVNRDTNGSNGAGKSVIPEAIVWGIFGRTIRKSTTESLVNLQTKKGCVVQVCVNDNVVIERGRKPTFLRFSVDGEDRTRDNALNTQKAIEEHLGTNYKVFLAASVFGQQNNIEFISATPDDKRSIIKNFLNLDSLFALRESVKYLKSEYSQGMKALDAIITEHDKSIAGFDAKLNDLIKVTAEIEGKYTEEQLSMSLEVILFKEEYNRDIDKELEYLSALMKNLEEGMLILEKERDTKECNECGSPIPESTKKRCEDVIADYAKKWDDYNEEWCTLELSYKTIPISSKEFMWVQEYQNLNAERNTFEELKEECLQRKQEAHDEKQKLSHQYDVMRFWEKAFSESGLVKYIIRNVLHYFNAKVNFYLSHLSKGKFKIAFDDELKETIYHNRMEIPFISLSGGERRKVNLAVMLGLQQLLTLSQQDESNLIFFDEVAENLDQDGLDGLYILLSELKKTKNLFVITHNSYLKSLLDNSKVMTVTKHKGTSKITRK